jgi:SAM-dependent methyltransferase
LPITWLGPRHNAPVTQHEAGSRTAPRHPRLRLILLSFLMLFVELGLIRYTSAYVLYLSLFTNFVLLASFLGVGVGFLRARARRNLFPSAPVALGALVVFVAVFPVNSVRRGVIPTVEGWPGLPALPPWIELPLIFLGAFLVMAFIAEGVARTFALFEPLEAYRLDILGSILGIVGFSVLSFLQLPPLAWAIVAAVGFVALLGRPALRVLQLGSLVVLIGLAGVASFLPLQHWSPYYRVGEAERTPDGVIALRVNGRPHQSIAPLDLLRDERPVYFFPYRHVGDRPLEDVLIIGAGNGNDVAVALSNGVGHVDAVEIDPVLYEIGRAKHPERPYLDPRVTVYIEDGRAFLHEAKRRYDLVLFALTDSLTLVAGQGALRLESYLFTDEAIREARAHLEPGGALSLYNYYLPHVFDRYARTLQVAFGQRPCVEREERLGHRRQAVLTVSLEPASLRCDRRWDPPRVMPEPATDDHPFPYLGSRSIPTYYSLTLLTILLAAVLIVRTASGPLGRMRSYLDLFFMGAAFLLLETKNVVQFALLFGTTWFVNALVFGGILLAVYLAIEVARRVRISRPVWLYVPLFTSLAVAWAVPSAALLGLSFWPRFAAATALAFAPVFLANLVFAERFKDAGSSTVAFGANLLGAMVGGVLEYGSLIVGYRALLVGVAALYALAFLTGRRHLVRPEPRAPVAYERAATSTRSA